MDGATWITWMLLFLLCATNGVCDFITNEESLRADLLTNYTTKVRPAFLTNVHLFASLASLNHLDIASQSMSINAIFFVFWQDGRLAWNSSDYGGLETLVTAPEDIWTPPIVIENALFSVEDVGVIGGTSRDSTPVRIDASGVVGWSPPSEISTSCEMLIAQYPFDTQTCSVVLIAWTYPLSEIMVTIGDVDVELYSANGEFDLISTGSFFTDIGPGPTNANRYRKLHFELTFRRKWQFYGQNLLMPIVLNSILMNAVFALPIESGEKMGYSLTVLLSYIVFLTWVTENLPPVSTDTSILQVYLAVVLCLGCLCTLLTTWVLHLYHSPPDRPISGLYQAQARRLLLPFNRLLLCKPQANAVDPGHAKETGQDSALQGTFSRTKVASLNQTQPVDSVGLESKAAESDSSRERIGKREFTWKELAVLFDFFFLWVMATILLILTVVILSLLYANY